MTISFSSSDLKLHVGSTVECRGTIVASAGSRQPTELSCEEFKLIGDAPAELMPFDTKNKSTLTWAKLRQSVHLRPREQKLSAMLQIRSEVITELYNYFKRNEYYNVTTPIITGNDCEGAGEVFAVKVSRRSCQSLGS